VTPLPNPLPQGERELSPMNWATTPEDLDEKLWLIAGLLTNNLFLTCSVGLETNREPKGLR